MSGRSSAPVESITRGSSTLAARRHRRHRAGREDRVLELERLLAAADAVRGPSACADRASSARPWMYVTLRCFDELAGAAGQPLDDAVLELAQLVEVDLAARRTRRPTPSRGAPRRSAWRRAAAPSTGCSRGRRRRRPGSASGSIERDAQPEVGREKRGGVAAGAAADDDELSHEVRRGRSGLTDHRARLPAPDRIPAAPARTAARAPRRSSAGSGCRRRRR